MKKLGRESSGDEREKRRERASRAERGRHRRKRAQARLVQVGRQARGQAGPGHGTPTGSRGGGHSTPKVRGQAH